MALLGLIGAGLAAGINAASQNRRDEKAMGNQRELMGIQLANQMALNQQGQQLQYEMWQKTNYPAQIEMMKKAGLNPGLMYGMSGGGGSTTGSQSGGSASGGQAPAPQQLDLANILQTGMMQAEIKLKEAQAKKLEVEAEKTAGIDTELAKTTIGKIIAETTNTKAKTKLTDVQTQIHEIEKAYKPYIIKAELNEIEERVIALQKQNYITEESKNAIILEAQGRAVGQFITNELNESKIKLNEETIKQKWQDIAQGWEQLDINQKMMKISKFKEEIAAEYPSLFQVGGSVAKKAWKTLENFEEWLLGTKPPEDKID